jgi:PhoPQ-activated pathogenicity-related protein
MYKNQGYLLPALGFFILAIAIGFLSCSKDATNDPIAVTAAEALKTYVDYDDQMLRWDFVNSYPLLGATAYDLELTSQRWREFSWSHQLTIIVPDQIHFEGALLWVTGGSNQEGKPKLASSSDGETLLLGLMSLQNQAVTAIIRQVPNQPLFGLSEDALISHTLNQFRNDRDYTWPLLFPMVKSVVRAMDAIQQFTADSLGINVSQFLVAGASKRGWTTWLTAPVDTRVKAIAPMVIDMLNMPVNLAYQLEVWGNYSPQIVDYVELGIAQEIHSELGETLATMIDPYSYRNKLTQPKMIFIGTNDPYWPVDAIKHYIDNIPGSNFIHYVPNAGHDLAGGLEILPVIQAFFEYTFSNTSYPDFSYSVKENSQFVEVVLSSISSDLSGAFVWSASSDDRDFRDEEWTSNPIDISDPNRISLDMNYPQTGFHAFYVDLQFIGPLGNPYTLSTRMFVCNPDGIL